MNARLGFLFCEIAFRGFDLLGACAYRDAGQFRPKWWAWPADALLGASYRLGLWFYGRAA